MQPTDVSMPRTRRDPGYVFQQDEEDEEVGADFDEEDQRSQGYNDVDELEGFEDWHMDDELHDGDLEGDDAGDYDSNTWPAEQEGLPELIFTEGCDDDGVDLGPCISLQRCSNGRISTNGSGQNGDVDAVRVMLLGVSDSGRPSVGIDLGYACTQTNQTSSTRGSSEASRSPGSHQHSPVHSTPASTRSPPSLSIAPSASHLSPGVGGVEEAGSERRLGDARQGGGEGRQRGGGEGGGEGPGVHEAARCSSSGSWRGGGTAGVSSYNGSNGIGPSRGHSEPSPPHALQPQNRALSASPLSPSPSPHFGSYNSPSGSSAGSNSHSGHARRPAGPASPFVFQPPRTPSKMSGASSLRRSFVFSEWAASNKQTFIFEGAYRQQAAEDSDASQRRRITPCKFVPTKSLTLAMQDASFVKDVIKDLPGVDSSDPRIHHLLEKIKEKRPPTTLMGRDRPLNSLDISSSLSSLSISSSSSPFTSSVSTSAIRPDFATRPSLSARTRNALVTKQQ